MAIKLSDRQQEVMKHMVEFSEVFADQMFEIMTNHGLTKIDGCELTIRVDPRCLFTTEVVKFGREETDSGVIRLAKGRRSSCEKFTPFGENSAEYELLFADEAVRKAIQERLDREKPLPPDGLWVGASNNSDPVDGWEWDVNDSLS